MITKVTHVTMFVHDQEKALQFYTNVVGLKVHTDAMFNDFRWLTLHPEGQADFELVLMPAATQEEKALVGKQASDKPFLTFETDDCNKEYQDLKARGAQFIQEPKQEAWGVSAAFVDLYGNAIYMAQQPR